ncbi:MAG: homoserine kinase [Flavobacteriales bacterium]|nr:homoserine kinase [Flavobacteriales bacterium]
MADSKTISATAPPTIANLAVGFDILGLAVQGKGDVVSVSSGEKEGVHISDIQGDNGKLSRQAENNTATAGIIAMLHDLGRQESLAIRLDKRMPLGSGMGSSASSAAAGVLAANEFLGRPFSKEELVKYALIGEQVASGSVHGDNVVPSLLGGLILMRSNEPADIIRLPFIQDLQIILIHPHVEVLTSQSRGRLKESVAMDLHIRQSADTSAFIHAMHTRDEALLKRCMRDHIIGPQRRVDIPLFDEVEEILKAQGAINYNISGSGPSSFAFFPASAYTESVVSELKELFEDYRMGCDIESTRVDDQGARILA